MANKLCLISEQNVDMLEGVCLKPMAEFQLPNHVPRFKMLNSLDMVKIQSFNV